MDNKFEAFTHHNVGTLVDKPEGANLWGGDVDILQEEGQISPDYQAQGTMGDIWKSSNSRS